MSEASSEGAPYRRDRSFSNAFNAIESKSPLSCRESAIDAVATGNVQALALLKSSTKDNDLKLTTTGDFDGSTLKINTISLD